MTPSTTTLLVLVPFIAWRIWARIRRNIGRQKIRIWRHTLAVVLLPLPIGLLMFGAISHPPALLGLCAGLAVGIVLAMWGLKLTIFERTSEGYWHTPHPYLGTTVALLFVGRIAWRLLRHSLIGDVGFGEEPLAFSHSVISQTIFGVFAGYRMTYSLGVLRMHRGADRSSAATADAGNPP